MVRKSGSKSVKNKCAPGRVSKGDVKWTCYSKESLVKMAKSYNVTVGNGGGNGKGEVGVKGASGLVNNLLTMTNGTRDGISDGISGGKPIYDISYSYEYSNNESALRANPFFYSKNIQEFDKEGVIVYKNEMTDQMINYLLMDSEELSQKCGMFWVQYKIKIMESLANLWD